MTQLYVWEVSEEEKIDRKFYKLPNDDTIYPNDVYRIGGYIALWDAEMYTDEDGTLHNTRMRPATNEEVMSGVVVGSEAHTKLTEDRAQMFEVEWLANAEKEIDGEASS